MGYDNFGLKIGVEGEREFKNSIRDINSSFRILKSEMNLLTATFKDNANSIESLTAKGNLLGREIEEQRKKIALLEAALKNASDSFGESDRRTQNWTSKLNYAKAELENMEKELGDVNSQVEQAKTPFEQLTTEIDEQEKELSELQTQYKNVVLEEGKNSDEARVLAGQIKILTNDINSNKEKLNYAEEALNKLKSQMAAAKSPLDSLNGKLKEQYEKLDELEIQYKNVVLIQGENSSEAKRLAAQIKNLTSDINSNKEKLNAAENALSKVKAEAEKSQAPLDRLNAEINEQGKKLIELQTQYKNVVLEQGKNSSEAKELAAKIKTLNGDITENKEKLKSAEKATDSLGDAMKDSGEKASKLSQGFTVMKGVISNLITDAIKRLGRELLTLSKSMVTHGIEFESAFAGVKKTVEATDAEFSQFETDLRQMSTQMPMTASELAKITEAAGQLGIKNDSLMTFTKTMANLGVATSMSSDEAAIALARLANITKMNQENFGRLGSSIVALGNNFATTETEISQMALNIAAAGTQVGMTEADILGVATALSSLGLEAQAGGTAISKAIIMMANSVETGSKELEYFAKAAGMSTADFKRYFKEDATGALTAFITGLGNLKDESALKFLDDMGINEIRLRDALLRASNANELFTNAIKTSNEAWQENTALTEEARKRYGTTESKVQILKNTFTEMGLTIFDKVQGPLQNAASKLSEFFQKANESGPLKDAIDKLSVSTGKLIEGISDMIISILPPLMELISWMIEHSGLVSVAIGGIVTAMLAVKAVKFADNIADSIGKMQEFGGKILEFVSHLDFMRIKELALKGVHYAVAAAQWVLNAAMDANPIGAIIAAIGLLITGLVLLWNNCEWFRNFIIENWQGLLLYLVNPVLGAFKLIYDNCEWFRDFVNNFATGVRDLFVNAWNAIVSFFTETIPQFIESVGQWFNELPYKIGYALGYAIAQVIQWGIDLWNFATTTVPEFIGQVVNFFSELPGKIWNGYVTLQHELVHFL